MSFLKGIQCCSATCGYNCLESQYNIPLTDTCCSISSGYREKCFQFSQKSCHAVGCCWDNAKFECFKQKRSCQKTEEKRIENIHLNAKWFLWSSWSSCECENREQRAFRACNGGTPGQGKVPHTNCIDIICKGISLTPRILNLSQL